MISVCITSSSFVPKIFKEIMKIALQVDIYVLLKIKYNVFYRITHIKSLDQIRPETSWLMY